MLENGVGIDPSIRNSQERPETKKTDDSFLRTILDKPLTVERIDNYASEAVDELILLINQKVSDYQSCHNTSDWDDKVIEDMAMKYYGLEKVESYLDFLAEKDEEIRNLDRVINEAQKISEVVIKPDKTNGSVVGNGGEFKDKKTINRVKTILFILKEDFDVDVDDEKQLKLIQGIIEQNMMRESSYFLVSVPNIGRKLLVCDEEGNASYVFNSKVLKDKNISDDSLINFTKTELNELIQNNKTLGKRVTYSKNGFVPRIIEAIKHPNSSLADEVTDEMKNTGKYLYKKAESDELSCRSLAKKLEMSNTTLGKIISSIDPEELGQVNLRKFRTKTVPAYTLEQQKLIIKKAEEHGLFIPPPEEGELSCTGLSKKIGVGDISLRDIISDIDPEELGSVKQKKFGPQITLAYTPKQQEIIIKKAKEHGLLSPPSDDDELSCNGLAKKLGTDNNFINKIISQIDPEELGPVQRKKFGSQITLAYTPKQQEIITKRAEENGLLLPLPEVGELSSEGLAKKLEMSNATLSKIISSIDPEELGQVNLKKFSGNITFAYTPEQQEIITRVAREGGFLASPPKDGELSCGRLAKNMGMDNNLLGRIIAKIDPEELGQVNLRKIKTKIALVYTLEQQEIIKRYVNKWRTNKT